ncbi:hypothetical protein EON66_08955 [archaeon]|nr:MAG: hypothetical protein EON66_08955 [archaeon]
MVPVQEVQEADIKADIAAVRARLVEQERTLALVRAQLQADTAAAAQEVASYNALVSKRATFSIAYDKAEKMRAALRDQVKEQHAQLRQALAARGKAVANRDARCSQLQEAQELRSRHTATHDAAGAARLVPQMMTHTVQRGTRNTSAPASSSGSRSGAMPAAEPAAPAAGHSAVQLTHTTHKSSRGAKPHDTVAGALSNPARTSHTRGTSQFLTWYQQNHLAHEAAEVAQAHEVGAPSATHATPADSATLLTAATWTLTCTGARPTAVVLPRPAPSPLPPRPALMPLYSAPTGRVTEFATDSPRHVHTGATRDARSFTALPRPTGASQQMYASVHATALVPALTSPPPIGRLSSAHTQVSSIGRTPPAAAADATAGYCTPVVPGSTHAGSTDDQLMLLACIMLEREEVVQAGSNMGAAAVPSSQP